MTDALTPQAPEWREPRFGDIITNGWASEDNPTRVGLFVREGRRTGRMNPGRYFEVTDGEGKFWELPLGRDHKITVRPAVDRLSAALAEKENSGPQTPVVCERSQEASSSTPAPSASEWLESLEELRGDAQENYERHAKRSALPENQDSVIWKERTDKFRRDTEALSHAISLLSALAEAELRATNAEMDAEDASGEAKLADERLDGISSWHDAELAAVQEALAEAEGALERIRQKIAYPLGGPTDRVTDTHILGVVDEIAASALSTIQRARGTDNGNG